MIVAAAARVARRCAQRSLAVACAALVSLASCAVGPDFERPAPPAATRYTPAPAATGSDAQRFVAGYDVPARWWTLFGSPEIEALVEAALQANPDLQAARAALRVALENVQAQRGLYYPSVSLVPSVTRERNAVGTLAPTLNSGEPVFNLYTAQVNVSYVLDAFGANRRQVEALAATAEMQRFQLEATYLTLVSNVMVAAIQEASLRAQVVATTEILKSEREQLALVRRQYELGAVAGAAVLAQETLVAQTEASEPALRKQLAQQRDLLVALTGRLPDDPPALTVELGSLRLPAELPLTLPSKLVEQRPDVRAAESQLHAASAELGVATAALLPQITLGGSAGGTSTELGQLFASGNTFWSIGAGLVQPLFAGGSLVHHKRAAEAALEQAQATYRGTVITAFQNVADTLQALEQDTRALEAQQRAERAAAATLRVARRSVELGAQSHLALLIADQAYQQAVTSRIQAEASRYADTVALFQALGGGWWNRSDLDWVAKLAPAGTSP